LIKDTSEVFGINLVVTKAPGEARQGESLFSITMMFAVRLILKYFLTVPQSVIFTLLGKFAVSAGAISGYNLPPLQRKQAVYRSSWDKSCARLAFRANPGLDGANLPRCKATPDLSFVRPVSRMNQRAGLVIPGCRSGPDLQKPKKSLKREALVALSADLDAVVYLENSPEIH
jgi:hypothetical protein